MRERNSHHSTGLLGPVGFFAGLLLIAAAPIMRGGNRYVALIPLEWLSLGVVSAAMDRLGKEWLSTGRIPLPFWLALCLASPALIAAAQLVPLPGWIWSELPGHHVYIRVLAAAGLSADLSRPLSVSPDATKASLLAGLPVLAGFLLGYLGSRAQLRGLLWVAVVVAFGEVCLGLLQIFGGQFSPLFFGVMTYGPAVGTFANRNHFANFLAMALAGYVWLTYEHQRRGASGNARQAAVEGHHWKAVTVFGAVLLVLGVLISRSRGALVFGLPAAALAFGVVALRLNGASRGLRVIVICSLGILIAAAAMTGIGLVTSRLSIDQLASSADFRGALAHATLRAALEFWPWGSGWGTYPYAFARFQPVQIGGYANHAHNDYLEMLLEGGVLFVVLALVLLWFAIRRCLELVKMVRCDGRLHREAMAAAVCGMGLLGFLLHSTVDFSMRIPANAIFAALLSGVFFRPLERAHHD